MALMKKFKVEGIGRAEQVELDRELSEAAVDPAEIDYLVILALGRFVNATLSVCHFLKMSFLPDLTYPIIWREYC